MAADIAVLNEELKRYPFNFSGTHICLFLDCLTLGSIASYGDNKIHTYRGGLRDVRDWKSARTKLYWDLKTGECHKNIAIEYFWEDALNVAS
jgi:hypothetical protein